MRRARVGRGAAVAAIAAIAAVTALIAMPGPLAAADDAVTAMMRRLLDAPEATASVVLERSDPFGGPPEREEGRLWYIPGRGLRYRAEGETKHEMALDRGEDRVVLYRPSEPHLYEATWARAPRRLRRLIADPERVLRGAEGAVSESREVRGKRHEGWRLREEGPGASGARTTVWVTRGASGLPHFVSVANDVDTLLVEFRRWSIRRAARPGDLAVRVPRGTPTSPLDPRDLLGGPDAPESD